MIELAKKILLLGLSVLISLCFVELYFWMREKTAIEPAEVAHLVGGPVMRACDEPLVRAVAGKPVYDEPVPRESAFLCLGDSFAFSWGVSDTGTFTFYLQKRLNHGKYFGRYRVYNLGQPATGLKTHSKIYEKIEKKLPIALC